MLRRYYAYVLLGVVATVLALSITFFQESTVHSKNDLKAIQCGWPFVFITLDQSWKDPPYPWKVNCSPARGYATTANLFWPALLGNVTAFYIALILIFGLFSSWIGRDRS